ncbi:MAG TPA: protein-methionine-sulfoxide reductase heme-binding subunit MsrQ [Bryobacteraceae bacterium]|nr:protein-methionine-sulfoxide reductase heme-binding subunit MsrQ [Bryobacteraceae bacterium]
MMWKTSWPKRIVFVMSLLPLIYLTWKWQRKQLGFNQIEYVARYTGDWTIRFLLLSLAITPLRRVPGLNPIIRFRRMLGLFAFFYGTLHALHYYARDVQWNWQIIVEDLTIRRFFIAGMLGWVLMIPLAATSFNAAIRWMGGKRWQQLHRLAYVSAAAGVIHFLWQGKALILDPLIYAGILVILMAARVAIYWRK